MSVIIFYCVLPATVKAFTHANDDGSYTIFINSHLSETQQRKSLLHELEHINGNDFTSDEQATILEEMARRKKRPCSISDFTFFYRYAGA